MVIGKKKNAYLKVFYSGRVLWIGKRRKENKEIGSK